MGLLKRQRIFFGASITVTRGNHALVVEREFVARLHDAGCRLFFYVEYIPVVAGTEEWLPTETQREATPAIIEELRDEFAALFIVVPGDEAPFGGCLAAGRGFVHISPAGRVEPCPFVPYSDVDLRDMTLREALGSELLRRVRERPEALTEAGGGCSLWEHRDWLHALLAGTEDGPTARQVVA
jgi:MoaA/NifB/PqqE/SkfB family radical SAM enzyme